MRCHRALAATLTAAALAGCGGGGGATTFDAAAAWLNFLRADTSAGGGYSMSGNGSDSLPYTVIVDAVGSTGTDPYPRTGEASANSLLATTLRQGGTPQGTTAHVRYFNSGSGELYGLEGGSGSTNECSTADFRAVLPRDALPGSTGRLYDATTFSGCGPFDVATATIVADWSIVADAGAVYFCVASVTRSFGAAQVTSSDEVCVQIDAAGALGARARVTLDRPPSGFRLVARTP